jgi:4-diphosphocytidyl-2-C-methyl-D-erythritol kinase
MTGSTTPGSKSRAGSLGFKPFSVESPAKINLLLKITGIRRDGYHNIASVFQMLDLCDVVTFRPNKLGKVRVTCSDRSIPARKNLAYLAAMALWKPGLPGVDISLRKKIPVGAGLGGGSSNAATVLWVLNRVWGLGMSLTALRRIGARLGADVPFFLFAPRAWVTGVGDRLRELPPAQKFAVLLVKPPVRSETKKAYEIFDGLLTEPLKSRKMPSQIGKRGFSFKATVKILENDLEKGVMKAHPVLAVVARELRSLNGSGVMLTGSGSAVYALFGNRAEALSAKRKIAGRFFWWSSVAAPRHSMRHLKDLGGNTGWK